MHKFQFDDDTEARLDAIVERIDAEGKWADEYQESEDSPVADYVTWGWSEGDVGELARRAEGDADLAPLVQLARSKGVVGKALAALLADASELELIHGTYRRDREIFGLSIGESEHELSEEVNAEVAKLTDAEFEYVQRRADYYVSRCTYGSATPNLHVPAYLHTSHYYDRWSLVCDADRLSEALSDRGIATADEIEAALSDT